MKLAGVTFEGPVIDDPAILEHLPDNLSQLIQQINGFIQFGGGLHVRGACLNPSWHSLRHTIEADYALHKLYAEVDADDIPFAQDCVGDQFLLRDGKVLRLFAETGEIEIFANGLSTFLSAASEDPVGYLQLEPLLQLQNDGVELKPGQLIHAYPPFCTKEAGDGVSLRPMPAEKLLAFHAELASRIPGDGEQIDIRIVDK